MLFTTLALCRAKNACNQDGPIEDGGYAKLVASLPADWGDDQPISLAHIVESNGIDDAIWALMATTENSDKFARLFACECAEHALHIFEAKHPSDRRPRQAIEVARKYANGEATEKELAAAWAVWAARAAAGAAAWDAEIEWQKGKLLEMLGVA